MIRTVVFSLIFGLALACGGEQAESTRSAMVFACDNPKLGDSPCFSSDDPKFMQIALRSAAGSMSGSTVRIDDPGSGLHAMVLEEREKFGNTWYKLDVSGQIGWVAEHLVVLE